MERVVNKKMIDTWGGVGSMLAGIMCLWFAQRHHEHESIWKVWVAFFVLLLANGIAMVVYAQRSKPQRDPHRL